MVGHNPKNNVSHTFTVPQKDKSQLKFPVIAYSQYQLNTHPMWDLAHAHITPSQS